MASLSLLVCCHGKCYARFNIASIISSVKLLAENSPPESARRYHTLKENIVRTKPVLTDHGYLTVGQGFYSYRLIRWNMQESIRPRSRRYLPRPCPENLPFTWSRPEKGTHTEKEYTGDLTHDLPMFDPSTPRPGFELSEGLKTADDNVKKIFTLVTATKGEINQLVTEAVTSKFQRHVLDTDSPEARVALLTVKIRNLVDHFKKFPQDKHAKVVLIKNIGTRKRLLRQIRQWDYQRFEWLLKELNITYKIPPVKNEPKITRKGEIRRLTKEYCEKVRHERLAAYHEKLKEQQKLFLKEKEDTLRWIAEEEEKLGIKQKSEEN